MGKGKAALLAAAVATMAGSIASAQGAGDGWTLAWSDEFEGPGIDRTKWSYDIGGGGWGNQESQFYTDRPENARIEGGCLVIEARREKHQGSYYTSARLKTEGLFAFAYGRAEARMKVPEGRGTWPAFWLLGAGIRSSGWPACGEIDVMEHVGREPDAVLGTIHGPGYSGNLGPSSRIKLGSPVADEFHDFAVEWSPGRIEWFLDGRPYGVRTPGDVAPADWAFDREFFMILNLAIGGGLGGPVALDTPFPARLLVDWVRVWQRGD